MVEHQELVNWLIAGISALIGWVLKVIWDAVQGLKKDMRQIERDLPEVYVRKDDFKAAMSEVKDDMRQLRNDMREGFNKIDRGITGLFNHLPGKHNDD